MLHPHESGTLSDFYQTLVLTQEDCNTSKLIEMYGQKTSIHNIHNHGDNIKELYSTTVSELS